MKVTLKDRCCLCNNKLPFTIKYFLQHGNFCTHCSGDCGRAANKSWASQQLTERLEKKRIAYLDIYGKGHKKVVELVDKPVSTEESVVQ